MYNLCHAICSLLTPIRQNKFFFLIRFLLVYGSGENRKSKYTGSVSPLFCSPYPFLINVASEYELAMNREFLFACFLCSLCPGGNSLESIKTLKGQDPVRIHWLRQTAPKLQSRNTNLSESVEEHLYALYTHFMTQFMHIFQGGT